MLLNRRPWLSTDSQVGQCKEYLSWANYQTYSDSSFNPCRGATCTTPSSLTAAAAAYGGWDKVAWGISTESQHFRPSVASGVAFQQHLQSEHPDMRGVMVWTAEFSSVCSP